MIALALLFQVLDFASFALGSTFLPISQVEVNPLVAAVFIAGGVIGVFALKAVLSAIVIFLSTLVTPRKRRLALAAFTLSGLIGFAANTIAIYQVLSIG